MNNILFDSFKYVNTTFFNNEYALIVPRFSSFFGKFEDETQTKEGLGKLISSYYEFMKLFKIIVNYDHFHRISSKSDMVGSREILFDDYLNNYFNRNLLSNLILIKKDQLEDGDSFSTAQYDAFIERLSESGKAKEYIKIAFDNVLMFLCKWESHLGVNLLQQYDALLSKRDSFLYKTNSAKKVLTHLLTANEYCSQLEWAINLPKENCLKVLSEVTSINKQILLNDFSKENFFTSLLSNDKNTGYYSLNDFLTSNFNNAFLEALFSDNPKQYIIDKLLEKVAVPEINKNLFSYLNKDLNAIEKGMKNHNGLKVLLHGVAGTGKTEFSKIIAQASGKDMYRIKMRSMVSSNDILSINQKMNVLLNISKIFNNNEFILLIDECEEFFENNNKLKEEMNYILDNLNIPCVFIANDIKSFHSSYLRRFHYHMNIDICDFEQKLIIVKSALGDDNKEVCHYIASHSITNADITDNINFYKATNDLTFLRQKIENKQITQDLMQLNNVEKSLFNLISPETNNHDFDTIIGYKEEKEILMSLEHYLHNKEKYIELKVKMPHGSILYGFPGTGKTSMIKALAKKCNLPLISVATGMMANDASGALNIKKIFNTAKKNSPCIILLDEFEKMALNRKLEMTNGTSQSLMNQLLMEMDELYQSNHDVFVYATCNTIDYIDPAISRSGRLEQMLEIGLPPSSIREKMLKSLLDGGIQIKGMKQVVQHTTGFSFVDLQSIVNNYKIALLKDTKKLSRQYLLMKEIHEFMLGKTSSGKLLKEEKELVAYHESGHAFLAYLFDKAVGNVSIIPKSGYLGVTLMLQDETKHIRSKEDVEHEVMILMGGRASESVFLHKETTGSGDDFSRATKLVMGNLNILANEHLGLIYPDMSDYNEKFSESYKVKVESSVNKILKSLYEKTKDILSNSKEEIESMVATLIRKEEMIQNEMEGLLHTTMTAKNVTKMSKIQCSMKNHTI